MPSDHLRSLAALGRDLCGSRTGNVGMIMALVLAPTTALAIAAVDFTSASHARVRLQSAVDAAALAAAATTQNPEAKAEEVFLANLGSARGLVVTSHAPNISADRYTYSASGYVKTSAAGLVGLARLNLNVSATAVRPLAEAADIAIVLDATNSMGFGSRWSEATLALRTALETMRAGTEAGAFHVSFVAYKDRANIGVGRSAWLDPDALAGEHGFDVDDWNGCVEPREETIGAFDYALDDDPAAGANLFTPSHTGLSGGLRDVREPKCGDPIVAPTTYVDDVARAFEDVTRSGTGRWDQGLAWGWRLVSPEWRGAWGAADSPSLDEDTRRQVVFIVDGNSTAYDYEVGADTANSYGYNKGTKMGFEHLVDLCERMHDDGVEILLMQIGQLAHAQPYFEDCASSGQHHFVIEDMNDWRAAFSFAASNFVNLRLIK